MSKKFLVSIIVPIYNQEQYLDISMPTLKQQTYQNLEIILVDDGSTDRSREIINDYLQQDKRFKCVYKENGGLVSATIAGIKEASGDYLAFLDPDDKLGLDYIENFVNELDRDYDFLAAGFFYDDGKLIKPYRLKENCILNKANIEKLRSNYLSETSSLTISNKFFVARWNKLYKTELVKKVAKDFQQFESISLGEDSVFTFLLLQRAQSGKIIATSNSYFYNIANPNSMMKDGAIEAYVEKCRLAQERFGKLLTRYGFSDEMSYQLYYFLLFSFFYRLRKQDKTSFEKLYAILKNNAVFSTVLRTIYKSASRKQKLQLLAIRFFKTGHQYLLAKKVGSKVHGLLKEMCFNLKIVGKNVFKQSPLKLAYYLKFQQQRKRAFKDVDKYLPIIEGQLHSDLLELQKVRELPSSIEKNIFVFWWDGFEQAPELVQTCLASVRKSYPDCRLYLIDKINYRDFTDIHPEILKDFEKGKISIQTFSDVLRFNLLKNNGGIWVDSTIYFAQRQELFKDLEHRSFSTLRFSTSRDFMSYKGKSCSWSGFLIASRKNGRLVRIIDTLFERYYLRYRTFSTYFFIDIIFMLCKIYKIDDSVLDKIELTEGNMFQMALVLDQPFNTALVSYIESVPQKLFWSYQDSNLDNFYKYYKEKASVHNE